MLRIVATPQRVQQLYDIFAAGQTVVAYADIGKRSQGKCTIVVPPIRHEADRERFYYQGHEIEHRFCGRLKE